MTYHYNDDPIKRKLFYTYHNMMNRCYWDKEIGYKNYGGRGIKVCDRWRIGFRNFYIDMLPKYREGLSLDRIDNDGDYDPDNCRWTTRKEQNNNTRRNHPFEFEGKTQSLQDWSADLGIKRSTLAQRVYVYKWTIEKAFNKGRTTQ